MLQIALLSRWHVHAEDYWKEAVRFKDVKITAVWDNDAERGRQWAKELNADFEMDLDTLLSRNDVDAVIVTCETTLHKEIMIKAANAGKHIFTEKVLAPTVPECREIAQAIDKSGVKFCISMPYRAEPGYLFAKKVIDEHIIGDVTMLRARSSHDGAVAGWLPRRFYNPDEAGGGAMLDLGAHPMYLCSWLLGDPISVSSIFTYFSGCAVEDSAVSILEFPNHVIAISETSNVSAPRLRCFEISGTKGTLRMTAPMEKNTGIPFNVEVYVKSEDGMNGWFVPEELPAPVPTAMEQWINGIRENTKIDFDLSAAIKLTELMEAAYISSKEKRLVYFNEK